MKRRLLRSNTKTNLFDESHSAGNQVFQIPELVNIIVLYANDGTSYKKKTGLLRAINTFCNRCLGALILRVDSYGLSDRCLLSLPNITTLKLHDKRITGTTVLALGRLTSLGVYHERAIRDDDVVSRLTNLTRLTLLYGHPNFHDSTVRCLTGLTSLSLYENDDITDDGLETLTRLTSLKLRQCSSIGNEALVRLTGLTKLDLAGNFCITHTSMKRMTQLTSLNLHNNEYIGDSTLLTASGAPRFTRLQTLSLAGRSLVSTESLARLTGLTELDLSHNDTIHAWCIQRLTNLTRLNVIHARYITDEEIRGMTHVRYITTARYTLIHKPAGDIIKKNSLAVTRFTSMYGT